MKKIIALLLLLVCINIKPFAQKKANTKTNNTTTAATKKDGTPDMRYKENKNKKDTVKAKGPLKKDGTPDKRFKANKKI